MEPFTPRDLLIALSVGASVLLWTGSRLWEFWLGARTRRANRDAFIRAIYAEVDFNTFDMSRFLAATVSAQRLEYLFEQNLDFVPHITDARHTEVYRSRIGELHEVAGDGTQHDGLVGNLVRFYGELEKVTQQIEGLSKASFRHISVRGKVGTIANIYATCQICVDLGTVILNQMDRRFDHLKLYRNSYEETGRSKNVSQTRAELNARLRKLSSDLDRVNRSGHS